MPGLQPESLGEAAGITKACGSSRGKAGRRGRVLVSAEGGGCCPTRSPPGLALGNRRRRLSAGSQSHPSCARPCGELAVVLKKNNPRYRQSGCTEGSGPAAGGGCPGAGTAGPAGFHGEQTPAGGECSQPYTCHLQHVVHRHRTPPEIQQNALFLNILINPRASDLCPAPKG